MTQCRNRTINVNVTAVAGMGSVTFFRTIRSCYNCFMAVPICFNCFLYEVVTPAAILTLQASFRTGWIGHDHPLTQFMAQCRVGCHLVAFITACTTIIGISICCTRHTDRAGHPVFLIIGTGVMDVRCIGDILAQCSPLLRSAAIVNICQSTASVKRIISNAGHTIRNGNACQTFAEIKCTFSDSSHAVANGNIFQVVTACKSTRSNFRHTFRNNNCLQLCTAHKCCLTDLRYRIS